MAQVHLVNYVTWPICDAHLAPAGHRAWRLHHYKLRFFLKIICMYIYFIRIGAILYCQVSLAFSPNLCYISQLPWMNCHPPAIALRWPWRRWARASGLICDESYWNRNCGRRRVRMVDRPLKVPGNWASYKWSQKCKELHCATYIERELNQVQLISPQLSGQSRTECETCTAAEKLFNSSLENYYRVAHNVAE